MDFYVYMYTNLVNGKRYIGKGRGYRIRSHLWECNRDAPKPLYRALKKHGVEAFEISYLATGLDEETAHRVERCFVAMYGTRAEYNLTNGGEGTSGFRFSEESKQRKREMYTGEANPFFGRSHSPESRERMSQSLKGREGPNKGRRFSDEWREKLAAAKRGRPSNQRSGKLVLLPVHKENMRLLKTLGASARDIAEWFETSENTVHIACRQPSIYST